MMNHEERITNIIKLELKTSTLSSSFCDDSDAYIIAKGTITVAQKISAATYNANRKVIFKNRATFTHRIN